MSTPEQYPEPPGIEGRRARLPRSDPGRLIRSSAILTKNGTAANAPTDINAIAAVWRAGRLILSATSIPIPSPIAARVRVSRLSSGSCSDVFGMDTEGDIGYL